MSQDYKYLRLQGEDNNIFLTMGKYVRRQKENLLTQSLAATINHSPIFQLAFARLLSKRGAKSIGSNYSNLVAFTQIGEPLRSGRLVVDLELREREPDNGPVGPALVILEAKLGATLTSAQLKRYTKFLKMRKRKSDLVILTKYGIDPDLEKAAPSGTIWLTWTEIAELYRAQKNLSNVERFLRKEFITMLEENNIPMVPPMSVTDWNRLTLLHKFATSGRTKSLHLDAIEALKVTMDRLVIHRDSAWSSLVRKGWKPYARVFAWRNDEDEHYVTVDVGFGLWGPRKQIRYRYLELSLDCRKPSPRLSIDAGWAPRKTHSAYDDATYSTLHEWSPSSSKKLFQMPLHNALDTLYPILKTNLSKFKRTRYFKGR